MAWLFSMVEFNRLPSSHLLPFEFDWLKSHMGSVSNPLQDFTFQLFL